MTARATSILLLAPEPLRASPTGPSRRAVELARVLGERFAVTLAAPSPSSFPDGPFRTVETGPPDDQALGELFATHDVAVVQVLPSPRQLLIAMRHAPRLVVDLIAPLALELLTLDPEGRDALVRWRVREMLAHLAAADLVLCTNERQRDLLVGGGLVGGLLDGGPELYERIAIVPHGLDPAPPPPAAATGLRTGPIGDGDRVAVWGGGMWRWLDPLTAVRAVERLRPTRPDVKLVFLGFDHPDAVQQSAHQPLVDATRAYARDHGLEDAVVFRPEWLPRDEFVAQLADADVGVSLHLDTLESRYASRTRVVDYLQAGLRVLASRGDTMSELVATHGLGRVVPPGDDEACAAALDALTRGDAGPDRRDEVLDALRWPNAAAPLVAYCAEPGPRRRSRAAALVLVARGYPAFARSVSSAGGSSLTGAALRRARSLLPGDR